MAISTISNSAAQCIQRAWKQSRTGLTLLTKYKEALYRVPHKEFYDLWRFQLQPMLRKGSSNTNRQLAVEGAVKSFYEGRSAYQKEVTLPICSAVGSVDDLPRYTVRKGPLPLDVSRTKNSMIYFTSDAKKQWLRMRKVSSLTQKELDSFTQGINAKTDLISWDFLIRGCFSRAAAVADLLECCGILRENIRWQFAMIPQIQRNDGFINAWTFHVAPIVKTEAGWRIVDPGFSPFRSLIFADWLKWQRKTTLFQHPPIPDKGFLNPKDGTLEFSYDPNKGVTFALPSTLFLAKHERNTCTIAPFTDKNKDTCLKKLAAYRCSVEQEWMNIRV